MLTYDVGPIEGRCLAWSFCVGYVMGNTLDDWMVSTLLCPLSYDVAILGRFMLRWWDFPRGSNFVM